MRRRIDAKISRSFYEAYDSTLINYKAITEPANYQYCSASERR